MSDEKRGGSSVSGAVSPADAAFASELVQETPDALIALGLDGKVLFWNRGAEMLFGFGANEVVGHGLEDSVIPADRRDEARKAMSCSRQCGAARTAPSSTWTSPCAW